MLRCLPMLLNHQAMPVSESQWVPVQWNKQIMFLVFWKWFWLDGPFERALDFENLMIKPPNTHTHIHTHPMPYCILLLLVTHIHTPAHPMPYYILLLLIIMAQGKWGDVIYNSHVILINFLTCVFQSVVRDYHKTFELDLLICGTQMFAFFSSWMSAFLPHTRVGSNTRKLGCSK